MFIKKGEYLLVVVTLVAAAGWLFSKNALMSFPSYTFLAWRFSIAAVVLAFFCLPQFRTLNLNEAFRSAATGLVLGLTLLLWVEGIQHTASIGEGAFIVSLSVIVVPIVGRIFFGTAIPVTLVFALLPAMAGLAFLSLDNDFGFEIGQWYFLCANLGLALHLNLSSHFVSGISPALNTTIQLTVVAMVAAVAALLHEAWFIPESTSAWLWLLASAVIATSFRFVMQNSALRLVQPSHAAMIFLLEPIWAAVLGVLFLQEVMSTNKIIGCMFIFTALLVYRWPLVMASLQRGAR